MKVYYQELNNQKCIGESVDELRCDIEDAIYEYYYGKINDSDAEVIAETTLYEIRKLDIGEYITKFGFNWGAMEMTREEFDNLGEFSGF